MLSLILGRAEADDPAPDDADDPRPARGIALAIALTWLPILALCAVVWSCRRMG